MRILFLSDDFPPASFGGAGISTYELARGTKKAGHEVVVITTCRKQSEAGESEYEGLKIFKIATTYPGRWRWYVSLYNPTAVRQVETLLKRIRPDVVNVNNVHQYLSYYCLKVAKRYAKVVVFTARDVMTFNFSKLETARYLNTLDAHTTWWDHLKQAKKRWNPLRNFFIKRYLGYADKLFAISKSLQRALLQNGISGVEVIYNGIDVHEWVADPAATERFRTKYNLHNKKVLLFSGRLSASKGGEKALQALALIAKEVSDAVLLVAGSVDEYARVMQQEAKKLGVEKQLIFTGWIEREEIKAAYATSDVVLMPSICLDTFGRVNIEAMAAKKPVIGTCYGGTPEVVTDRVTGYIVNPLYPKEIADKTLNLLKNPKKAEAFGQAGYERVKAKFSMEEKVNQYLLCYHSLL